ncbi:hypothetical protein [Aegicerativicinus sediminis]|uniref:hypothetical protein n=1 Tax=Aegicerativicinus sediminis TaxID=2893202 RepID=UPI001E47E235|nr:hypothetical protein [Aegicerativicinus sediminis]
MKDLLLNNATWIFNSISFLAALTGVITYKSYKHTNVRYFIFFLVYAYLVSVSLSYTQFLQKYEFLSSIKEALKGTFFELNYWMSTIFWRIGATIFIVLFYYKTLKNNILKRILVFFGGLFFLISIFVIVRNLETLPIGYYSFHQTGSIVVIFTCVTLYFIELMLTNEILDIQRSATFYISWTLLIFYNVVCILIIYKRYYHGGDMIYVNLQRLIYIFANIFMYSMFIFALLWCRPQKDQ